MPEITIYAPIDNAGAISDVPKISVTDSAAISHALTAGKKGVALMNVGTSTCWVGGSTVDPANSRGIKMLSDSLLTIRNTTSDFKIYFKCGAGLSTTIGVIEYD